MPRRPPTGSCAALLATAAERVKRDGASTVFSAQDLAVDERTQRVGVRGTLTTFISDRRVSEVSKGYAIELQYAGGRIFLKAFRETSPNDPLEIQASPSLPGSCCCTGRKPAPGAAGRRRARRRDRARQISQKVTRISVERGRIRQR